MSKTLFLDEENAVEKKLKTFLWLLWVFLIFTQDIQGQLLSPELGTIIVTYQTDLTGQRLDRIRFWLINDHQERTLYPKKNEFVVNNQTRNERTVVITNLPAGHYRIEFLIPNTDNFFENIPPREITLDHGAVAKVDQAIRPHQPPLPSSSVSDSSSGDQEELALIIINRDPFFRPRPPYPYPYPPLPYPYPPPVVMPPRKATFSLQSNLRAPWKLLRQQQLIYSATGSVSKLSIPPGKDYYLLVEDIPGYTFYITPKAPFDVYPGQDVRLDLLFQREAGYLNLEGTVPSQVKSLSITLHPQEPGAPPIQETLIPINGKVTWQSGPLPTGEYELSYNLPAGISPIGNQSFTITKERYLKLQVPSLIQKGSLQVTTDSSQALFTLESESGAILGEGKGYSYTFKDLEPGDYILSFSTSDSTLAPPQAERMMVSSNQNAQFKASYQKLGSLTIISQEHLQITIQSALDKKEVVNETLNNRSHTFNLPEGHYLLFYQSLTGKQ